jgi:hypothetical protein
MKIAYFDFSCISRLDVFPPTPSFHFHLEDMPSKIHEKWLIVENLDEYLINS